ncbi:MAG: AbrB/MazE/SpoVT family DNA-binding domain-containing protein [Nanoarchaeota archaeon]|nr:AbrB/MazE/SpoVT family DNA-binding domain-containing protein [Nanoarchaeota archaeon]
MIEIKMEFEVTRLGERGQIVIPQIFREHLKLKKGEKFMVMEQGGTILLKRLSPPTKEEFEQLLKKTHEHARKHKLTEEDMWHAIEKTRRR